MLNNERPRSAWLNTSLPKTHDLKLAQAVVARTGQPLSDVYEPLTFRMRIAEFRLQMALLVKSAKTVGILQTALDLVRPPKGENLWVNTSLWGDDQVGENHEIRPK